MVQSLALGLDAFATSAATQGRAGGVPEVQDVMQKQEAATLAQQQNTRANQAAERAQKESDLRMKTMNAQLLMNEAAYHHALQMYPAEEKAANLDVLNKATASYKDAMDEGYDIADPGQAALWRQMQQNIISIPFSSGQSSQEVMSTVKDAASKDGKNLTDFAPLTDYTDGKHGSGGTITLVPIAGLQQVQATPRQITTGMAQMKATLDTATSALGADDPDVKALTGKIATIQKTIDSGGSPSAYDFIQLKSSVLGPLSTRIAGVIQSQKVAKEKSDTIKAAADATKAQREADPALAAQDAGTKAAAVAKAQQPYQVALKQTEAPIAAGVASDKEAREKVDGYAKSYVEKLQGANELISSLAQAEAGNAAASKAAIFKMAGMALPAGGKRGMGQAIAAIEQQGNIPQKFLGKLKNALTGDEWTSAMSQDMREFAQAQADVAAETLKSQIRILNVNHKTKIDPQELIDAAGHLNVQPSGPQGSKWGTLIPDAKTLQP